jgi:hypothetical protein
MPNNQNPVIRETAVLPAEVWRQFPGKWIIYSEEQKRVIGVAETLEEASAQAQASGVGGEWHYHHALPPDEELLGSL